LARRLPKYLQNQEEAKTTNQSKTSTEGRIMKTNWITRGAPVIALLFLAGFGMMSCSTDPVSSPDTQSENIIQSQGATATESPTMNGTDELIISGHLRMDPTGQCWYLISNPFEVYELKLDRRLRVEANGHQVSVWGNFPENVQPRCSNWPVFKTTRIIFE
jgi:hypothetical protein